MQERFKKLVGELRPISSIMEETGISRTSIEKKLSGLRPVRLVDILALERVMQLRDERLEWLVTIALRKTAAHAYSQGFKDGSGKAPGIEALNLHEEDIASNIERSAKSVASKSVFK